ncbi:MAG: protein translocase subunit SecD [Candidatus Buchananbacteria bacterium]|nr:protein translocase subunit SecD [Candidatus Buchananbacteria bacterium]
MRYINKIRLAVLGVFILVLVAAFFDFPSFFRAVPIHNPNLPFHLGLDLQGGTHLVYETDLSKVEPGDQASAVEGVRDVIERRVNAFGVAEPLIQTSQVGDNWRIIVELAGVKDVDQAIKMIGETPLLEFKEVNPNPQTTLTDDQRKAIDDYNAQAKTQAQDILNQALRPNADFAALAKQYSQDPGSAVNGGDLGLVSRGQFVPEFDKACFDDLKVGQISKTLVESQFGYHIVKKNSEQGSGDAYQADCSHILIQIKTAADYLDPNSQWMNTELTGAYLKKSQVQFTGQTQAPEVALEFNGEGAKLFEDITRRNVGKPVAIFLDGQSISTPTVQDVITGGKAVINGNFNVQEAKLLAQRLNAGALPVPINLIAQETIGSSLGRDSLQKSLTAGAIGLVIVILFMIFFYRLPGIVAALTLFSYGILVMFVFKLIPVTLSLAGIAGFILSIGMAVDANVLVFERIKEELKAGKTLEVAIKEGFKRAWPSIFDGNVSTLITCLILISFTTSLVKGFAVTLTIGIIVSIFSAMVISKVILQLLIRAKILQKPWLFGYKLPKVN